MKDQMKKRMQTINQDLTETEIETMIDSGTMDQIYGQGYMSQVANAKQQLSDIQDRHDEMKKLERSIEEVHRLFMEMQQLVTVQVWCANFQQDIHHIRFHHFLTHSLLLL